VRPGEPQFGNLKRPNFHVKLFRCITVVFQAPGKLTVATARSGSAVAVKTRDDKMRFRFGINRWKAIQALVWAVLPLDGGQLVQVLRCTFIWKIRGQASQSLPGH
jgi:hypothetical protein